MKKYFIFLFLFLIIIIRFFTTRPVYKNGQKIRISAQVFSEPIRYSSYQNLSLIGLKISLPLFPEIHYGDKITIEGTVENKKLVKSVLIDVKETTGILPKLRSSLIKVYQKTLSEPHSSLVTGIVLGVKSGISEDLWSALKKTGTAHVVVASGMNVSIVAGFFMSLMIILFPRRKAIVWALIGIWLYAVMSGLEAPIVRAVIMGSITFTAQELGRLSDAWRALFLSAFIMLTIKPDWLIDTGFILSFVATGSMMLFQKRISNFLKRIPEVLRNDFSTSLAAQIGVSPILYVTFGYVNILSPFINLLVLWTIAPIMMIASLGGLVGLFVLPLGRIILYLVYPLTGWFIVIVKLFGK